MLWNIVNDSFQNQSFSYLTNTYIFAFEYTIILSILHLLESKGIFIFSYYKTGIYCKYEHKNKAPAPHEFNQQNPLHFTGWLLAVKTTDWQKK